MVHVGNMELRSRSFWIEVIAELLVTLLFLFMVCGTVLPWNNSSPSIIHIAFSHGLSIATLVLTIQHVSGGQLNPAVTICMLAVGRVSVLKAVFFIAAQCIGGKYPSFNTEGKNSVTFHKHRSDMKKSSYLTAFD